MIQLTHEEFMGLATGDQEMRANMLANYASKLHDQLEGVRKQRDTHLQKSTALKAWLEQQLKLAPGYYPDTPTARDGYIAALTDVRAQL